MSAPMPCLVLLAFAAACRSEEPKAVIPKSAAQSPSPSDNALKARDRFEKQWCPPEVTLSSAAIEAKETVLDAGFSWGTRDEDWRAGGRVKSFLVAPDTCLIHVASPGYWYAKLEVVMELRQCDDVWQMRGLGMLLREDIIQIGPDGEAVVEWQAGMQGNIALDAPASDPAIRCDFTLRDAKGFTVWGQFTTLPESADSGSYPFAVNRYIRDAHVMER